jgi:hypothetical protein
MYTAEERMRAIAMLNEPMHWPKWPILPMKRTVDGDVESGFAVTADHPTVILKGFPSMRGIILQLAIEDGIPMPGSDEKVVVPDELRRIYHESIVARYDDIDGMLDDGWRID